MWTIYVDGDLVGAGTDMDVAILMGKYDVIFDPHTMIVNVYTTPR